MGEGASWDAPSVSFPFLTALSRLFVIVVSFGVMRQMHKRVKKYISLQMLCLSSE